MPSLPILSAVAIAAMLARPGDPKIVRIVRPASGEAGYGLGIVECFGGMPDSVPAPFVAVPVADAPNPLDAHTFVATRFDAGAHLKALAGALPPTHPVGDYRRIGREATPVPDSWLRSAAVAFALVACALAEAPLDAPLDAPGMLRGLDRLLGGNEPWDEIADPATWTAIVRPAIAASTCGVVAELPGVRDANAWRLSIAALTRAMDRAQGAKPKPKPTSTLFPRLQAAARAVQRSDSDPPPAAA